jgi:hypothetical protein
VRKATSLEAIVAVLEREPDLVGTVRRHLTAVEQSIALQRRLQHRLGRMLEQIEQRRQELGDQGMRDAERAWAGLIEGSLP